MNKIIIIQNLVAPYRVYLFNRLCEYGLDIELYYMRYKENDRSWEVDLSSQKYPFYIDKGVYLPFNRYQLHFNPSLIRKVRKNKNAEYILGSPWNSIDLLIICLYKRLGIVKSKLHIWSEANYLTVGSRNDNFVKSYLRKFVFNSIDGSFIVPGEMSVRTFTKWKIKVKNYIFLPNIIQQDVYAKTKSFEDTIISVPLFVIPARLDEKVKGILNFFMSIGLENIRKGVFYILGDGPDAERIRSFIIKNELERNIILAGFCDSVSVLRYYLKTDVLILPSFSDSSPLVVVEALSVGLPLLISNRCGNHYEALIDGVNGYLFDPENGIEIKNAFEKLIESRKNWAEMGRKSRQIFKEKFEETKVLKRFIYELTN